LDRDRKGAVQAAAFDALAGERLRMTAQHLPLSESEACNLATASAFHSSGCKIAARVCNMATKSLQLSDLVFLIKYLNK
jgi:hypothetical protein